MRSFIKSIIVPILCAALSGAGVWYALRGQHDNAPASASTDRKVLFYQSAMHPWVKSDKPGRCTICGMELTPVYEGEKGIDATGDDIVSLSQSQIQVLHVQTAEAKVQPLTHRLQVAGMIDDDDTRHRILSAYADGRIEKLKINYIGAEVTAGQPIADIYSPSLLLAESEYIHLLKGGTAAPASIAGARVKLERMGLGSKQIEALPQKPPTNSTSELLAPMGGTVVSKSVYEGQYVSMGQQLFEIADFSVMWFQFLAYEQDIPWIKMGQTVAVTTPSLPGRVFTGAVKFIDPTFDEATRSTKVRVELPNVLENGRHLLLHRLYADGVVEVDAPEVLAVPRSSVLQTGPEAVVYVEQAEGAYARTPVKTGRRGDDLIEIISGLKAGDRVVTNGNLLIDGQAEMNRSFATPPAPPMAAPALTDVQSKSLDAFLKVADAMAAALSDEKLSAFNDVAKRAADATREFTASLQSREGVGPALDALSHAAHFTTAADLMQARTDFHHFTMAAVPVLEPLRAAPGAPAFQVWECYMVDRILDDVPKTARWLQLGGRPGHNPFFGSDMLECAKEIKP